MKTLFGYTWIGWTNIILVQWLFVRIYYNCEPDGEVLGFGILAPVVPLTGWFSRYIPRKPKTFRVWGE